MPVKRLIEGLCALERCHFCLVVERFPAAVKAGRTAVSILPKLALSHSTLSIALFQDGRIVEALDATLKALEIEPESAGSLANAIQYLVWSGRRDEAEDLWSRLQALPGDKTATRLQQVRAATVLEEDEVARPLLQSLIDDEDWDEGMQTYYQIQLATAEADLGNREQALKRLHRIEVEEDSYHSRIVVALEAGRSSLGYTGRFSYIQARDLIADDRT